MSAWSSSGVLPLVVAVDVGGTKIEVGVVDADGTVGHRARVPTAKAATADELLDRLDALVTGAVAATPEAPVAVGVGCGGPMTPGGERVSPLNIGVWRDVPLRAHLAELTSLPVFVDNDAKALALGEGWRGAARDEDSYLAMVVSTGVGGGLVVDGRLLDGGSGNAGHVGHVIVAPDGERCACGAQGCLEAEVSGPSIERRTGRPPAEADAAERERAGRLVGRAVASCVALLDLRVAVVAGSVALGFGEPFFAAAQAELSLRARLSYAHGARIVPAGLGADGPLVGAAAVAHRGMAS